MRLLASFFLMALLTSGVRSASKDEEDLVAIVELLELDYEDQCVNKAEADWAMLLQKPNALEDKLDVDKAFGEFAKTQAEELKAANTLDITTPILKRRAELILNPGETLLPTQQWLNFVSYVDTAEHAIEYTNQYTCDKDKPNSCSYPELLSTIATSKDHSLLDAAKQSWESKLPDEKHFETEILPLLLEAGKVSGKSSNLQNYWEMLVEYGGAFEKAEELWEQISPLYEKLRKYVAKKLELNTDLIPAHWLGTLFGDDWTNVANQIVPHANVLQDITRNMQKKQLGGRTGFKAASNLLKHLRLGELKDVFWRDSQFEQSCPTRLVNFCTSGSMKVFTCKNISFPLFLDAHDALMAVKSAEIRASYSTNSHILREPNRISPLIEAVNGLGSLLAVTPEEMSAEILPSIARSKHAKLVLQFMTALRDLPKLSYYYAADQFRLKLLEFGRPSQIGSQWSRTRSDISKLSTSDKDYLGDLNIIANKPYIGKFFATILKYQILDSLTSDAYDSDTNVVQHLSQGSKLKKLISEGYLHSWQNTLKDVLDIQSIDSKALYDYYQPLNEFLSSELGEESNNDLDTEDEENFEGNEDEEDLDQNVDYNPVRNNYEEKEQNPPAPPPTPEVKKPQLDTENNKENSLEQNLTENYQNNPNLIEKESEKGSLAASPNDNDDKLSVQEASALQYAWIALGLLLLIVLVLAIVVARKRYKHKKELEKERREGSA